MTYTIKITIKCSHYFICTFILIKGSNTVQAELLKGYPNAEVAIDMASSVVKAIKYVTKSSESDRPRIALLTPYIDSVHKRNVEYLTESGIDVVSQHNLGFQIDTQTTSMKPASILEHSRALVCLNNEIDAIFIGCSAFRSTGSLNFDCFYSFVKHHISCHSLFLISNLFYFRLRIY